MATLPVYNPVNNFHLIVKGLMFCLYGKLIHCVIGYSSFVFDSGWSASWLDASA